MPQIYQFREQWRILISLEVKPQENALTDEENQVLLGLIDEAHHHTMIGITVGGVVLENQILASDKNLSDDLCKVRAENLERYNKKN